LQGKPGKKSIARKAVENLKEGQKKNFLL